MSPLGPKLPNSRGAERVRFAPAVRWSTCSAVASARRLRSQAIGRRASCSYQVARTSIAQGRRGVKPKSALIDNARGFVERPVAACVLGRWRQRCWQVDDRPPSGGPIRPAALFHRRSDGGPRTSISSRGLSVPDRVQDDEHGRKMGQSRAANHARNLSLVPGRRLRVNRRRLAALKSDKFSAVL
jgi:hypothetical protein